MVALLTLASFGFYCYFWMYGRARDLKSLGVPNLSPWLWFFSPAVSITLLWSVPRVMGHYATYAQEFNIPKPRFPILSGIVLWAMFLLILLADLYFENFEEHAIVLFFLPLFVIALVFAYLQRYVGRVIRELPNVRLRERPNKQKKLELVALALSLPTLVAMLAFTGWEAWTKLGYERVADKVTLFENRASLILPPKGWRSAPPGTHLFDSSHEFVGPTDIHWVGVARHDGGVTLNDVIDWHFSTFSLNDAQCADVRSFVHGTEYVGASLVCEEPSLLGQALVIVYAVESENGVYAASGAIEGSIQLVTRHRPVMVRIVHSLDVKGQNE